MKRYVLKLKSPSPSERDWIGHNYTERKSFDILTGLALAILSDGELTQKEANFLSKWIEANSQTLPETFIRKLLPIVRTAGAGSELSATDLQEITCILEEIAFSKVTQTSSNSDQVIGTPCALIYDETGSSENEFQDMEFIFSGNFLTGKKIDLMSQTASLGASAKSANPTRNTDFVVVGSKGSEQWAYSGLGRKVEHAMSLRDSGCKLRIISEEVFSHALERHLLYSTDH